MYNILDIKERSSSKKRIEQAMLDELKEEKEQKKKGKN